MENLDHNISDVRLLFEYNVDINGVYLSPRSSRHDLPKSLLYIAYDFLNFEVAELILEYEIDMTKQDWLLDIEHLPKGLGEMINKCVLWSVCYGEFRSQHI